MFAAGMQESVNGFSSAQQNSSFVHGVDKGTQPRRQYGSPPGQTRGPVFKVYIQNVPLEMAAEDLQALFSKFGDIASAKVLPAKEGYSSIIGFIGFATEEQASAAIEQMNGVRLDESHVLRVSKARERGEQGSRNQQGRQQEQRTFSPSGPGRGSGGGHEQQLFDINGPGRGGNINGGPLNPRGPGQASYGGGYQKGAHFNSAQGNQRGLDSGHAYEGGYQPQVYQQPGNFNSTGPDQGYNMQGQFNSHGGYQQQGLLSTAPVNGYQQQGQFDPPGPQETYNGQDNSLPQQGNVNYNNGPPQQGNVDYNGPPQQGNINYNTGYEQGYFNAPPPQGNFGSAPGYEGYHDQGQFNSAPGPQYQDQGPINSAVQGGYHDPGYYAPAPGQGYPSQPQQNFSAPAPEAGPGYGGYQGESSNQPINDPAQGYQQQGDFGGAYQDHSRGPEPHGQPDFNSSIPQQGQGNSNYYQSYPDTNGTPGNDASSPGHRGRDDMFLNQASGRLPRSATNSHNSSGGQGCFKCGEVGHFSRECPNQSSGGDRACHNCGEGGHFSRECPNKGDRGSGDRACHKCGEEGHFARECPSMGNAGDRGCFNCGEAGHFSRECPNPSAEGEKRPAAVTYIPPEMDDVETLFKDVHPSGINFDKYDNIPVQVTGKNPPPAISMFEEAGLLEQCTANVRRAKYIKPTPIQKHSIPITLSGRDLMACAQTGSGKTAAFLLPVMTSMIRQNHLSGGPLMVGETQFPTAICIAPTRELAIQISVEAHKFSDGTVIKSAVCYGGVSVNHQLDALRRGCHFLVATPGRLEDFISRNRISLENVKYLILDEADRMLDMGFEPAIRKIVERCGMTPKRQRQTLLFSATFPEEIQRLAADFLKEDYLFVAVGRVGGTNHDITQTVVPIQGDEKRDKLFEILKNSGSDRTLVFVELKRNADFLACLLSQNNFPTTSISGDRTQYEREAALKDFRTGRAPVMVATSVAARGLDIPDVKHVINYDLPKDIDEYVHRIGRTGRIGNKGQATSFFEQGRDDKMARSLVKVLGEAAQVVPDWLERCAEGAVGTSYGPVGGRFASRDHREGRENRPRSDMTSMSEGMACMNVHDSSAGHSKGPRAGPGYSAQQEDEESWD